ncbi:hypothetical protein CCP3SC15_4290002 [Gammaproteobacteria bacterium]
MPRTHRAHRARQEGQLNSRIQVGTDLFELAVPGKKVNDDPNDPRRSVDLWVKKGEEKGCYYILEVSVTRTQWKIGESL